MPLFIVVEEGETRDVTIDKDVVTVGRASATDIPLQDIRVSRQHCSFIRKAKTVTVKDGGSQKAAIDGLMDLLGQVTGNGGRAGQALSLQSSATMIQIQQDASVSLTSQAVTASTDVQDNGTATDEQSGRQIDVSV